MTEENLEKTEAQKDATGADDESLEVEVSGKTKPPEGEPEEPQERTYTQEEYKGLQRVIGEKDRELKGFKGRESELEDVRERLGRFEEGFDLILDHMTLGQVSVEEPTQPDSQLQKRRQEWATKRRGAVSVEQRRQQQGARQFMDELTKAGINPYDPEATRFFGECKGPDEAIEKIPEYLSKTKGAKETEINAAVEAATSPLLQRLADMETKLGFRAVETGGPSSPGVGDLSELNAALRKGEITADEFTERSKEMRKQQQ